MEDITGVAVIGIGRIGKVHVGNILRMPKGKAVVPSALSAGLSCNIQAWQKSFQRKDTAMFLTLLLSLMSTHQWSERSSLLSATFIGLGTFCKVNLLLGISYCDQFITNEI